MQIEWQTVLSWLAAAVTGGWFASWLALRKDERAVQIEQITKERAKWRGSMRSLAETIASVWVEQQKTPDPARVAALRAMLATSINPKDFMHDKEILEQFDELFAGKSNDLPLLSHRFALLLKHDWERVKWECTPLYIKPFVRFTERQRSWRRASYRDTT